MKILQVAPNVLNLNEDMTYGGIERLIIQLSKEYTNLGYENYVTAPEGNNSLNNILATLPESYWTSINKNKELKDGRNLVFNNIAHLAKTIEHINDNDFDIVHDHTGKLFPFKKILNRPLLTTLHGPSDWFWNKELYKEFFEGAIFNAISQFQRKDYSFLDINYVVYNGLDLKSFPYCEEKEDYLFSLGQITEWKGPHLAIEIAKRTGNRLILGGNIIEDPSYPQDRIYFNEKIKPYLKKGKIEFVGELNDQQKKEYYKKAKAFLMPINCKESFGLVLIESMACGTPVIAFNRGAIPEIATHGLNGYIAENVEESIEYIKSIRGINPKKCRESVLERFDISVITKEYISVYEDVIGRYKK